MFNAVSTTLDDARRNNVDDKTRTKRHKTPRNVLLAPCIRFNDTQPWWNATERIPLASVLPHQATNHISQASPLFVIVVHLHFGTAPPFLQNPRVLHPQLLKVVVQLLVPGVQHADLERQCR